MKKRPEITKQAKRFSYKNAHTSSDKQLQFYYTTCNKLAKKYSKVIIGSFEIEERRIDLDVPINIVVDAILKRL